MNARTLETSPSGAFTLEQLRGVRRVVSHGRCPDGVASAMIVHDAYARHAKADPLSGFFPEILFVAHSTREHRDLEPRPGTMFVDFSPKPDRLKEWISVGTLVLDHHVKGSTVQAFVEAGLGVFGDEATQPGVCGATLAYEHVWKPLVGTPEAFDLEPLVLKEMARLSGIRDTWQTKDPSWLQACKMAEALRWWPETQLVGTPVSTWPETLALGEVLWDKKTSTVRKIVDQIFWWTSSGGIRVAFFQGSKFSSDVTEALDVHPEPPDIAIGYDLVFEDGHHKMIFSTRSHKGFDCAALALAHGGGGHTAAAGFSVPFDPSTSPNPYKLMQDVLSAYEGKA